MHNQQEKPTKVKLLGSDELHRQVLDTGLLYAINRFVMHPFGLSLALVSEAEEGEEDNFEVAVVAHGGPHRFTEELEMEGRRKLREYLNTQHAGKPLAVELLRSHLTFIELADGKPVDDTQKSDETTKKSDDLHTQAKLAMWNLLRGEVDRCVAAHPHREIIGGHPVVRILFVLVPTWLYSALEATSQHSSDVPTFFGAPIKPWDANYVDVGFVQPISEGHMYVAHTDK